MKRLFKMIILALQVLKFEVLIRGFLLFFFNVVVVLVVVVTKALYKCQSLVVSLAAPLG